MKAHFVIGLGYGDEGKGITTDYLCSQLPHPVVIRHSGGQQAGHTVIKDGVKHIHSNFGSGSLRGIPTYFTEHTTVYPTTVYREWDKLKKKGLDPQLTIHPLTSITTPFDVFANRQDTVNLDNGTCGLGVGKTMNRNHTTPYKLYAVDLLNHEIFQQKMTAIGKFYGFDSVPVYMEEDMEDFYHCLHLNIIKVMDYNYLRKFHNLIFEGSQGILLDMDHGIFPNVTYANTTSKNAHNVCDRLNIAVRNVYYVTRAYATRHGAGYFPNSPIEISNNQEEINVNNQWQKEFKTGQLDYNMLNYALEVDAIYSPPFTSFNLVVTCCDQVKHKEQDSVFDYNRVDKTYFSGIYESYSPESKNFIKIN